MFISKRLFLIISIASLSLIGYGQTYMTLAACGNDPLRYIEKNYQDNAAFYVGKTIDAWADQCELQLSKYRYIPVIYSPWRDYKSLNGKVELIRLDITYSENTTKYVYYIYIYIDKSTPVSYQAAIDLEGEYDENWGPKFYNFYKNIKIKKIDIGKAINGEFINDYRRPVYNN